MGVALQVVQYFSTGLMGGAFEALTAGTGDPVSFYNVPQGSAAYLGEIWAVDDASPCEISLTASRFHDQVFGIRAQVVDGSTTAPVNRPQLVSPAGLDQPIFPSDVLAVNANGIAADNVNVSIVMYYPELPGINARLIGADAVKSRLKNLVGIAATVTPGAGDWGATVALNAADNRLHANQDYAVVGFTSTTPMAALAIQGVDTGNLRVGSAVVGDPEHDSYLFYDLSRQYNQALIPVINSNNAGATLLQGAHTAAVATPIDVLLVELS